MSRRMSLVGVLTAALVLVMTTSALAAGKPVNIGTPFESSAPSVAVDSSGSAVIAWANTKDLAGANDFVQYCVVPQGVNACSHSGNLIPADGAAYIDNVQVLVDGSTDVILADVYGAVGDSGANYEPEQEWQSADGGATFTAVAGGQSVSSGILNADTAPLSAVIVPGGDTLGYGWNTAGGSPPTFNAFPLTAPPACSEAMNGCATGFAQLQPDTNPDQISNAGGQFASQLTAAPGVMGIFNTDFTNGPLGCSSAQTVPFGTAYAYGSGVQSAGNNYNVSPGSPGSAWKVAVALADCNVEYPAVAGGPSGFGILETNELKGTTVYHPFDAAHSNFDTPQVTISPTGEIYPALSQDGLGGIYATYLAGSGGAVTLAYSPYAGQAWEGPTTLDHNTDGAISNVTSSVNAAGKGWASWTDNGSVFAQSFTAHDALAPPVVAPTGTGTPKSVTITITCSGPCTVTITISIGGSGASKASVARVAEKKKKKHSKVITLGRGRFTIRSKGAKKLKINLSRAGRKYLAAHHGRLKVTALISEKSKGLGGTVVSTRTVRIKIKHKK